MNANAPKMTLEEKIVQNLKDEKLYALLGDEDAIAELVKRAIREALYQPARVLTGNYRGYEEKDSPVVAAAREAAQQLAAKHVAAVLADPAVTKAMNEAIAAAIPDAIRAYASGQIGMFTQQTSLEAMNLVRQAIQNRTM